MKRGSLFVLDGKIWTVKETDGIKAMAERIEWAGTPQERVLRTRFDAREVVDMGENFYGLPGRIDAPRPADGAIVADVAVADATSK